MPRWWPRSLKGQMLLAVAIALLLAQAISAFLLYKAQSEQREAGLVNNAAFRLIVANRPELLRQQGALPQGARTIRNAFQIERSAISPYRQGEDRKNRAEARLKGILTEQSLPVGEVIVFHRPVLADTVTIRALGRQRWQLERQHGTLPDTVMIASVMRSDTGEWNTVRVLVPPGEGAIVMTLISQTLLIYAVLFGAIAFIVRQITRPLAALTGRIRHFGETRAFAEPLASEGPDDVQRLIEAHNAMEGRILGLLDEKNVMLGAIGHDLKTPLAALRVRIESVEDELEREKMAGTIEDITRTLDDILSLARVGRPTDPLERTEISALVASVAEEYEDMGKSVSLEDTVRIALPVRATWLRRALRNLIDNALRYGHAARLNVQRGELAGAVITIEDDGPGIAEADIAQMMEPFARGDPSRNSGTGGAGLGLALARAIAEQHGGNLRLSNRRGLDGAVQGLRAVINLPG